ncbi:Flp family type IVb pilin [Galenea microaerophila]
MKSLNKAQYKNILNQKSDKKQKGATMIEYAIVVAAMVAIAAAYFGQGGTISTALEGKLDSVAEKISDANTDTDTGTGGTTGGTGG